MLNNHSYLLHKGVEVLNTLLCWFVCLDDISLVRSLYNKIKIIVFI